LDENALPQDQIPHPETMSSMDFLTLKMLGLSEAELRDLLSPEEMAAYRAFLRRDSAELDSGSV
jgi:hypothetical protein